MKKLSIIIVNWNGVNLLKKCLDSICVYYDKVFDIVVVDNNSKDNSCDIIENEYRYVKLIKSKYNLGFGRANNIGFKNTQSEYLLFLNPDTVIIDNSFNKMIDFLDKNEKVAAVGCKMIYPDGTVQSLGIQWYPNVFNELLSIYFINDKIKSILKNVLPIHDPNKNGFVKKIYGGCIMIRKSIIDKIGVFDERYFMYAEDVDLCKRLTDNGNILYYMSDAKIIHYCGGSSNKTASDFSVLMKCDSIKKYIEKHHGYTSAILYKIVMFTGSIYKISILSIIKLWYICRRDYCTINKLNEKINKYKIIASWSLNIKKSFVPS